MSRERVDDLAAREQADRLARIDHDAKPSDRRQSALKHQLGNNRKEGK